TFPTRRSSDLKVTGFIFVLNPEQLPIVETKEAIELLAQYDLHVKTLVVNRIIPEQDEGQFFRDRKKLEQHYLEKINEQFTEQQIMFVPFFSHDINNDDQLQEFADHLVWDEMLQR